MKPEEVHLPDDLDRLDKDDLIAFLMSEREGKVQLWNAWREATYSRMRGRSYPTE